MAAAERWSAGRVGVFVLCVVWCVSLLLEEVNSEAAAAPGGGAPAVGAAEGPGSVCEIQGCNCTQASHKDMLVVNCSFESQQKVELRAGMISDRVTDLSVQGGLEVVFHEQTFTKTIHFQRLRLEGTRKVSLKKHAFLNMAGNSLLVQMDDCDHLVFEAWTFKTKLPVTVEVSRSRHVVLQSYVWSYLQQAAFSEVRRLEMMGEAFCQENNPVGHHGPVTTIRFRNTSIPYLPKDAFKTSLAEVSFDGCEVGEIQTGSFSGNTISAVEIRDTGIRKIHSGAFSELTLIGSIRFAGCRLGVLASGALQSGFTNFTLQHCNISIVETNATTCAAARVSILNNEIGTFRRRGFALYQWNTLRIESNLWEHLGEHSMELRPSTEGRNIFTFTGNELMVTDPQSLSFLRDMLAMDLVDAKINTNYFKQSCQCALESWLEETLGRDMEKFSSDNYCTVDSALARCFDVPEGLVTMRNFTDRHCSSEGDQLQCRSFPVDPSVVDKFAGKGPDNVILGLVLGLVLLIAVCGTVVILLVHGGLWLRRKGYCVRFSNNNFQYRAEDGSTEAEDIMTRVDKENRAVRDDTISVEEDDEDMPDELTQELLQALREKLENPLTHQEAREMIERLYEHFIVEDSYTNNNHREEETHLYEELGGLQQHHHFPPPQHAPPPPPDAAAKLNSMGRPFNFLRLIEERFNLPPSGPPPAVPKNSVLVGEYSEPTDAEVHLYSELPHNGKSPDVDDKVMQSNTQRSNGSGKMAYRPLPDKPPTVDPGQGPSTKF